MIDLKKAALPDTVKVDGRAYPIQTDYRYWIRFSELIADKKTSPQDLMFMFPYAKPPIAGAMNALFEFYNPKQELPRRAGNETNARALDYILDEDLIWAGMLQQYGIDIKERKHLHWYKFQAMLRGLKDTKLNEIISYRLYENKGKQDDYTREMERMRQAWALPDEATDKALEEFNALLD